LRRTFNPVDVTADTSAVEAAGLEELRRELSLLETEEALLSAERARLHHQIDFGFETGTTRERERKVSAVRRDLQQRIDLLRKLLSTQPVD
jgi:hypothetical protein